VDAFNNIDLYNHYPWSLQSQTIQQLYYSYFNNIQLLQSISFPINNYDIICNEQNWKHLTNDLKQKIFSNATIDLYTISHTNLTN